MDDYQQYQQALEETATPSIGIIPNLKEEKAPTKGQQIQEALEGAFGADILRDTLGEAASVARNRVLQNLGFTDDELDVIDDEGLRKGLRTVIKNKLKDTLKKTELVNDENPLNEDAIRAHFRINRGSKDAENQLKLFKNKDEYIKKYRSKFPDTELSDNEIDLIRQKNMRKIERLGKKALQDEEEAAQPKIQLKPITTTRQAQRSAQRQFQDMSDKLNVDPEDLQSAPKDINLAQVSADDLGSEVQKKAAQQLAKTTTQQVEKQTVKGVEKAGAEELGEEGLGEGLLGTLGTASEFLGPIGVLAGAGLLIGSLFTHKKEHKQTQPVQREMVNPSSQFGLSP